MYILARKKAGGGFNIKASKNGGFQKLMRHKVAGYGMGSEVYDNLDKGKKNSIGHLTQKMNHLSVKTSKPRKYISLNL
jgi:hypothetical protein